MDWGVSLPVSVILSAVYLVIRLYIQHLCFMCLLVLHWHRQNNPKIEGIIECCLNGIPSIFSVSLMKNRCYRSISWV